MSAHRGVHMNVVCRPVMVVAVIYCTITVLASFTMCVVTRDENVRPYFALVATVCRAGAREWPARSGWDLPSWEMRGKMRVYVRRCPANGVALCRLPSFIWCTSRRECAIKYKIQR